MARSAAAGAAATTVSLAETVQISLPGNAVSMQGGGALSPDITRDGQPDLLAVEMNTFATSPVNFGISAFISGTIVAFANYRYFTSTMSNPSYRAGVGVGALTYSSGVSGQAVTNVLSVRFTDERINGGLLTNGLLEVRAENLEASDHRITFVRTIFDDASTETPTILLGTDFPEFIPPVMDHPEDAVAEKSRLNRKIRKLKQKAKAAKRAGNVDKANQLNAKVRKLKKKLKSL